MALAALHCWKRERSRRDISSQAQQAVPEMDMDQDAE